MEMEIGESFSYESARLVHGTMEFAGKIGEKMSLTFSRSGDPKVSLCLYSSFKFEKSETFSLTQ